MIERNFQASEEIEKEQVLEESKQDNNVEEMNEIEEQEQGADKQ